MNNREVVKHTVTIELPQNVNDFLEDLARLVGTSLEEMLKTELESMLRDLGNGGLDAWMEQALRNREINLEALYDC